VNSNDVRFRREADMPRPPAPYQSDATDQSVISGAILL
jgi:hypothetical protein